MEVVTIDDTQVRTDAQGRYCLNDLHKAAIANGKATDSQRPAEFLKAAKVQEFIAALDADTQCDESRSAENIGNAKKSTSVKSTIGGKSPGTYAVELVAIRYAAWIDPGFEIRVYRTFQKAAHGNTDWRKLRAACASSSKVQSAMLQEVRQQIGKATAAHHHMNEHKLINSLLTGEYKGLDRENLSTYQLDFLAHFELRNAVLIGMGLTYEQRKGALKAEAMTWAQSHDVALLTPSRAIPQSATGTQ